MQNLSIIIINRTLLFCLISKVNNKFCIGQLIEEILTCMNNGCECKNRGAKFLNAVKKTKYIVDSSYIRDIRAATFLSRSE